MTRSAIKEQTQVDSPRPRKVENSVEKSGKNEGENLEKQVRIKCSKRTIPLKELWTDEEIRIATLECSKMASEVIIVTHCLWLMLLLGYY